MAETAWRLCDLKSTSVLAKVCDESQRARIWDNRMFLLRVSSLWIESVTAFVLAGLHVFSHLRLFDDVNNLVVGNLR